MLRIFVIFPVMDRLMGLFRSPVENVCVETLCIFPHIPSQGQQTYSSPIIHQDEVYLVRLCANAM
jgi:hypothetical protein